MATEPIKSSSLKRSLPTPFLIKTYQLVDDPAIDDIISWNDNGSTFIVWQPVDFCRDLLPKFFKHNNLSSFVRQLNTYGFRKVVSSRCSRWEFANDNFKRGEKHLLSEIHRGKHLSPLKLTVDQNNNSLISQGNSSVFSTSFLSTNHSTNEHNVKKTADIVAENDRLRKENTDLNQELSQMINMCNNIRMMTSNYAKPQKKIHRMAAGIQCDERDRNSPLGLMPMKSTGSNESISKGTLLSLKVKEKAEHGAEENPKKSMLFGISLGLKRQRVHEEEEQDSSREQQ